MINFTPKEWEAVQHRIESDAIPEVLAGDEDGDYKTEDVEAVCECIRRRDITAAVGLSVQLTGEVLKDCVEGSTYIAAIESVASPQAMTAAIRTMEGVRRKVSDAFGIDVKEAPAW